MVHPQFLYRTFGAIVGVVLLVATLPFLGTLGEPSHFIEITPPAVTFTPAGEKITSPVPNGAQVQNAGALELGLFAALRLEKYSAVTLANISFEEKTRTIKDAKIIVKTGRVWLANHVAGARISLADERVVVQSEGGSLLFDKTPPASQDAPFTKITAVTNPAKISFIAPGETRIFFETALPAGHVVMLSSELVTSLLNAPDRITRATIWQNKIAKADVPKSDSFYNENKALDAFTINRLVENLHATLAANQPSALSQLREFLTFLPAAKARYWRDNAGSVFLTALDHPGSVDWQRIGRSVLPYPAAREVFAALVPYTRLIAVGALPEKTKHALEVLATLNTALSATSGTAPAAATNTLLQELAFVTTDTVITADNIHLKNLQALLPNLPPESIELAAAGLSGLLAQSQALPTAETYALLMAPDATRLANLLANHVALAESLAESANKAAAAVVTEKLQQDLATAQNLLANREPLNLISDRVAELGQKLTYLGTLHGAATFDSEAFAKWRASGGTAAATSEIETTNSPETTDQIESPTVGTESVQADTPEQPKAETKASEPIARPAGNLQKVFDLLKADVTALPAETK